MSAPRPRGARRGEPGGGPPGQRQPGAGAAAEPPPLRQALAAEGRGPAAAWERAGSHGPWQQQRVLGRTGLV